MLMRYTSRSRTPGGDPTPVNARTENAAVLLEVVLALTLFAFAAGIVSSGLNSAVQRTLRLHEQAHALDLAASVLAEIEIGLRTPVAAGPEPFEAPFEGWTCQIEAAAMSFGIGDASPQPQVTVIVRSPNQSTVQRLTALFPTSNPLPSTTGMEGSGALPWLSPGASPR